MTFQFFCDDTCNFCFKPKYSGPQKGGVSHSKKSKLRKLNKHDIIFRLLSVTTYVIPACSDKTSNLLIIFLCQSALYGCPKRTGSIKESWPSSISKLYILSSPFGSFLHSFHTSCMDNRFKPFQIFLESFKPLYFDREINGHKVPDRTPSAFQFLRAC